MVNKLLKSLFILSLVLLAASSMKAQTPPACSFTATNPSVITKFIFNGTTIYSMPTNEKRGYIDSSSYVINVFADDTIPFTVQGFKWIKGGNQYAQYFRIFVDYNGLGTFTDTGELLFNSGTVDYQFTGNLIFPSDLTAGNYRMRLLTTYNNVDALTSGCGTTDFGQAIDFTLSVKAPEASIISTLPTLGDILIIDSTYTTLNGKRPRVGLAKKPTYPSPVNVAYKIYGPYPINNIIYEAFENSNLNDTLINVTASNASTPTLVTFSQAKGVAARGYNPFTPTDLTNVNGELDLHTYKSMIPPGEYTVQADLSVPSVPSFFQTFTQAINIAFQNDIALTAILLPQSEDQTIYPMVIPLRGQVENLGTAPISGFTATATVYYQNPNTQALTQVFQDTQTFEANPPFIQPMATGVIREVNFNSYTPTTPTDLNKIGRYKVVMTVDFLDPTITDQNEGNNVYPRSGAAAYFCNLKAVKDVKADSATFDLNNQNYVGPDLYVGSPVYPIGRYSNLGLQDVSNSTISYTIRNSQNVVVYQSDAALILQDLSIGKFIRFKYPDPFIPLAPGNYTMQTSIIALGDLITSNNTVNSSFTVKEAMSGTYTIGLTNISDTLRNFTTIRHAVDTLFLKGIAAPVDFILTDSVYNEGDATIAGNPALDLSSKIVGVSNANTVTFHPSDVMNLIKGDIVINLHSNSQSGIGILIGQSVNPADIFSPVSILPDSRKHEYANSTGNITIDGGQNKAIKLNLITTSTFRAAVYLANSANYCSIKNLIITDQTPIYSDSIPKNTFNAQYNRFEFEADARTGASKEYTSGVVMRSIAPIDPVNLNNPFFMDSLPCTHNTISYNEIYGFGYGVVSLGTGPLYRQGTEKYLRYYNKNNYIGYNTIYSVGRAGIFVGHEETSTIEHNRISDVNLNLASFEPAGIIAGGEITSARNGYNNINLVINANEISAVHAAQAIYGIKIEQDMNAYPYTNPSFVNFPDIAENMQVENNIVRNLITTNVNTNTWGIRLFTARSLTVTADTSKIVTPYRPTYFSRNDQLANNTVLIQDDGMLTKGVVVGVGLQNVTNAYLHNNAIAMLDITIDPTCYIAADVFYEGVLPNQANILDADRNALWFNGADGETYRFIEIDANSTLIEGFTRAERNDYKTLTQWQMWGKQDFNTQFGNFTNDLVVLPGDLLRIVYPPPLGSILNNRGDIINWVTKDIDNNQRGTAGQRYDIGASEFSGSLYASDVEVLSTPTPGAYMRGTGSFTGAEHVMAVKPISVIGRIRNDGSLEQTNLPVTVSIYRERPDVDSTFYTTPEVTATVHVDAVPGEVLPVDFHLANGLPTDFNPLTYTDLRGGDPSITPTAYYTVPQLYATMAANVTPRYKIVVTVPTDQNNSNNTTEKIVRFYIMRSTLSMILSGEHSNTALNVNSIADEIAGRLNFDSLRAGAKEMNWIIDTTKDKNRLDKKDSSRYDYDIFERTGWEIKDVNYSFYRTMFWSDGDDAPLTRYENIDINNFLNLPVANIDKKNLVISSQDMERQNLALYPATIQQVLSADAVVRGTSTYTNPIAGNGSSNGNSVVGLNVGRGLTEQIASTLYPGDPIPLCGLMKVSTQANGLARPAYYYVNHSVSSLDSIMGVASTTTSNNILLFGVEWRHWKNIERLLESVVDFINNNGGVVPIELVSFDAEAANAKVRLTWATQSEYLSDRFEIERAQFTNTGKSLFTKIAEQHADGTRNNYKEYDPIYDYNVVPNNTYIYRLKMVDQNGEFSYSNEVEVQVGTDASNWLGIAQPNPAQDMATFQFSLMESSNIDLSLYDMTGNKVRTILDGTQQAGRQTVKLDLTNLSSGSYMYVLRVGDQTFTNTLNVIK